MSLKLNILANYVSQLYVMIAGIVMLPLYLKYMGAEAYGLVGFFSMLQAWFSLLDMGLSATISRSMARFRGGVMDALSFRRLVRALESIFLGVALIATLTLFLAADSIVSDWLKVKNLPFDAVKIAVQLMAINIALRWMSGLYRGAVSGAEQLVWLGGFNVVIATLRFVLVLPILIYVGATPKIFFSYQLFVALVELFLLLCQTYRLLPAIPKGDRLPWSWAPLKPVLKFSLTIAFTSSVWVLVTQTDKLVLSKILPLAEYGYFTLAVLVANGVSLISNPISGAILPRMAKLEAEGNYAEIIKLYRQATQMVAIIAGAAAVTVAFCAEPLLWAWTHDQVLAHQTAPILRLYALGNGILALAAFPYYLQYAKGDLKLHLIGNAFFVIVLIPAIIWATTHYGGIGAGYVWVGMNVMFLIAWVPVVHHRFLKGLHLQWLFKDVGMIIVLPALCAIKAQAFIHWPEAPISIVIGIVLIGTELLLIAAFGSSWVRYKLSGKH